MEKRIFYRSKIYYISAVFSFLLGLIILIFPLRKIFTGEIDESSVLIKTLLFFTGGLLIALFSFVNKIISPELVLYMRVLTFYAEKDGEKKRWSVNVLDLESVTVTDRLPGETEEVNSFPYIVFRTKKGEEYEYVPIKSPGHIKRVREVIRFLNSCPGVPPVLNDIRADSYRPESMIGTGSTIKH